MHSLNEQMAGFVAVMAIMATTLGALWLLG